MNTNPPIRVPYALAVFGDEERAAVNVVMQTPMIVPGERVRQFEQKIADLFGKKYGIMVNSGSSANMVAVELLNLPSGSEVITPALTFSTTIAPMLQKGLVPVFADVKPGTYLIDIDQIEELISEKTKALMIPSLIGNIPDYRRLQEIARAHNLFLIEDSCDTLGAKIDGVPTGTLTDISTTSFYASHIITTAGGGGMICVSDSMWQQRAKVLAGWGRSSAVNESEKGPDRFAKSVDGIPYDGKFIFQEVGYNFQSTEIAGAFGLEQLKRFPAFFEKRKSHFADLNSFFRQYEELFVLPEQLSNVETAWLAFPLLIKDGAPFERAALVQYLEERNIQTRPIFTGNVLRQPGFSAMVCRRRAGGYPVADMVMKGSLLIGCNQGLGEEQINYLKEVFTAFIKAA